MKKGQLLRLAVLLTPCLVAAAACDRPEWSIDESAVNGGSSSFGGSGFMTTAGTISVGGVVDMCAFDRIKGTKPIFGPQTVNTGLPARQELYALVTDAEAEALRGGGALVPPGDPMARPDAVKLLDKLLPVSTPQRRPVLEALKARIGGVRKAWPNPWALRLVDHAGSEHMNPVRIVLRPDAWLARIMDGRLEVINTTNGTIGPEEAAAHPENIAAVFYEVNQSNYLTLGLTQPCEEGRREYDLVNEAAIEEWSLGTPEILTHLDDDLAKLDEFFKVSRLCSNIDRGTSFRSYTVCMTWPSYNVYSEYTAYQWSLATPNELYKPSPQNLASLIEALQGDRFEPDDPYVVMPAPAAVGGAGNEGGAGAGGVGGAG